MQSFAAETERLVAGHGWQFEHVEFALDSLWRTPYQKLEQKTNQHIADTKLGPLFLVLCVSLVLQGLWLLSCALNDVVC